MSKLILFGFLNLSLIICYVTSICEKENSKGNAYTCYDIQLKDLEKVPSEIEKLSILRAQIPVVTSDTFSRFSRSLVTLECRICNIKDIKPNAFKSMTKLQLLDLTRNEISSVSVSWISDLQGLSILNLASNKFESINADVFQYLRNLTFFGVSSNRLTCLDLDEMSKMEKLNTLGMQNTPDFQCPVALIKFLKKRNIHLAGDNHWMNKTKDTRSAYANGIIESIAPPSSVTLSSTQRPPVRPAFTNSPNSNLRPTNEYISNQLNPNAPPVANQQQPRNYRPAVQTSTNPTKAANLERKSAASTGHSEFANSGGRSLRPSSEYTSNQPKPNAQPNAQRSTGDSGLTYSGGRNLGANKAYIPNYSRPNARPLTNQQQAGNYRPAVKTSTIPTKAATLEKKSAAPTQHSTGHSEFTNSGGRNLGPNGAYIPNYSRPSASPATNRQQARNNRPAVQTSNNPTNAANYERKIAAPTQYSTGNSKFTNSGGRNPRPSSQYTSNQPKPNVYIPNYSGPSVPRVTNQHQAGNYRPAVQTSNNPTNAANYERKIAAPAQYSTGNSEFTNSGGRNPRPSSQYTSNQPKPNVYIPNYSRHNAPPRTNQQGWNHKVALEASTVTTIAPVNLNVKNSASTMNAKMEVIFLSLLFLIPKTVFIGSL